MKGGGGRKEEKKGGRRELGLEEVLKGSREGKEGQEAPSVRGNKVAGATSTRR